MPTQSKSQYYPNLVPMLPMPANEFHMIHGSWAMINHESYTYITPLKNNILSEMKQTYTITQWSKWSISKYAWNLLHKKNKARITQPFNQNLYPRGLMTQTQRLIENHHLFWIDIVSNSLQPTAKQCLHPFWFMIHGSLSFMIHSLRMLHAAAWFMIH